MKNPPRAIRYLLATALTAAVLLSCGKSDGDDDGGGGDGPGSSDATTLAGAWTTGCLSGSVDSRVFRGDAVTTTFASYSDDQCAAPELTQEQSGVFVVGGYDAVNDATALDVTVQAIFVTLHTDSVVATYNQRSVCGGGWKLGERRQLTKRACSGVTDEAPDVAYDVFRVTGSTLLLGKKDADRTGHTAESRPSTVDLSRPFQRR